MLILQLASQLKLVKLMNYFSYQNGVLNAENVSLEDIAKTHGTPCYVYSKAALEERYMAYENAFGEVPHLVCYAVKANSNLAVLSILARAGAGFDIVSVGELERVIRAGGRADRVVFSGVGKQAHEIERALELGVHCFNIESEAELYRIADVAERVNKVAPVSLRVNPDVDAGTHPYISTGLKDNKFGVPIDEAEGIYLAASKLSSIKVIGVDCHIGSQLTETDPFLDALDRVLILVDRLAEQGIQIEHLDIGGGLGVTYDSEKPPAIDEYVSALLKKIDGRQLKVVVEPGRSIAANAGILLTQVEFLKSNQDKHFAIIDAAMNDLLRPALYSAWQNIVRVHEKSDDDAEERRYDLVGPICETGDFLGKDRLLSLKAGDLLAVMSSGAYGFAMSSNYNSRNRVAELVVDGDKVVVARKRETIDDQLALEQVMPG